MRGFGLAAGAVSGGVALGLLARGDLTLDTGLGRTVRALGPVTFLIDASREIVFDVIAMPYLGRTPRALAEEISVLERGGDMVLAAHRTRVEYTGELGTDFWAAGRCWGMLVARKWEATVRASLERIRVEAERREAVHRRA